MALEIYYRGTTFLGGRIEITASFIIGGKSEHYLKVDGQKNAKLLTYKEVSQLIEGMRYNETLVEWKKFGFPKGLKSKT